MADRLQHLTTHEVHVLSGLGPHTRGHAIRLLARFPSLSVSSGRRTPERNRQVGGAKNSFHLVGRAVDFTGTPEIRRRAAAFARQDRLGARCTGPEEVIYESDHLHVAW